MKKKANAKRPVPVSCPCGSNKAYSACCKPFHEGQSLPTRPEDLVRARFSAYALGLAPYLWSTLHSAHDDRAQDQDYYVAQLARRLSSTKYRGLRILDRQERDSHGIARVLFAAEVHQLKRDLSFVEQADFVEEDGQWRYIVGTSRPLRELSHHTSDMRLDHWQCDDHHH